MPYVGDSKRAMDEYTSEIFMGGRNTIVMHNTCEDSLLAAPIILDLVLLAELTTRIQVQIPEGVLCADWAASCNGAVGAWQGGPLQSSTCRWALVVWWLRAIWAGCCAFESAEVFLAELASSCG